MSDPRATSHILARLTVWDPAAGAQVVLRYGTVEWVDDSDDAEVYAPYLGGVSAIERSVLIDGMFDGGDRAGVTLTLTDHKPKEHGPSDLAPLKRYWWEGWKVELWWGLDTVTTLAAHIPLFAGITTGIGWDDEGNLTIPCEDALGALDTEIQDGAYDGSGGYGGTSELAGLLKQIVVGQPLNVPCRAIDRALGIFQVGDPSWTSIAMEIEATRLNIQSAGIEIEGDSTDLYTATITPAKAKTDKSRGLVRINMTVRGEVAADARAEAVIDPSSTAAGVARLLAAAVAVQGGVALDEAAFDALDAVASQTLGWCIPSGGRLDDQLRAVLASVGAFRTSTGAGALTVALLSAPTAATEDDCDHVYRGSEVGNLQRAVADPPPHTWRVGYDRNWRPFTEGEISGESVEQGRADFLTTADRFASETDPATRDGRRSSTVRERGTALRGYDPAAAEARRRLALLGGNRDPYTCTVEADPGSILLGQQIWIEHPDHGLAEGRPFRVVAFSHDPLTKSADLQLFG